MTRTCLHCVLGRAMRAESAASRDGELALALRCSEPTWLPLEGGRLYRELRGFLREAREAARRGLVKLAVLDLPGKSHVEVTAVVRPPGGKARVLSRSFPRQTLEALGSGFAEQLAYS
ncbi:MAG: hypothetical protein E6J75_10575 [Deltaproteobacteria bacterium]|nr:MAG: hypothetical protein E6J79_04800 [Deltaproteobacteria bacterium]TMA56035.1 MAG: hypothetical protein E6J75_10575 [Deltaproteobacteria bacterium]